MKVCIIGFGIVGLTVSAAALIKGHEVIIVDLNNEVIQYHLDKMTNLEESEINYNEYVILRDEASIIVNPKIKILSDYAEEMDDVNHFIICVETHNVKSVPSRIAPYIKDGDLISLESTVTPEIVKEFKHNLTTLVDKDIQFSFVVSPERVMEGTLLGNFIRVPKIIGADTEEEYIEGFNLYDALGVQSHIRTTIDEACIIKMWENYSRYRQIRESHELIDFCNIFGYDFDKIREGINSCGYGRNILDGGIGIGGSCLSKDTRMLWDFSEGKLNCIAEDIKFEVDRHYQIVEWIKSALMRVSGKELKDVRVMFFGATYKPNGSDIRNSPSLKIIDSIKPLINKYYIYDPLYPMKDERNVFTNDVWKGPIIEIDAIVLLVAHEDFEGDIEELLLNESRIGFVNVTDMVFETPHLCRYAHRRF